MNIPDEMKQKVEEEVKNDLKNALKNHPDDKIQQIYKKYNEKKIFQIYNYIFINQSNTPSKHIHLLFNVIDKQFYTGYLVDEFKNNQFNLISSRIFDKYKFEEYIPIQTCHEQIILIPDLVLVIYKYKHLIRIDKLTRNQQYFFIAFIYHYYDQIPDINNSYFIFNQKKMQFQLQYSFQVECERENTNFDQLFDMYKFNEYNEERMMFLIKSQNLLSLEHFSIFLRRLHEICNSNHYYKFVQDKVIDSERIHLLKKKYCDLGHDLDENYQINRGLVSDQYQYTIQYLLNLFRQAYSHGTETVKNIYLCRQRDYDILQIMIDLSDNFMEQIFKLYEHTTL